METITQILIWMGLIVVWFTFTPNHKIKAIGGFFKDVQPRIPFTGMIEAWRNNTRSNEKPKSTLK